MKKNVLIFGAILGVIISINLVVSVGLLYSNPDFKANDVVGYAAMVVIFSLSFFGIRNYRNRQLGGVISFGRAFKTGALIALLGATIYVVFWLFYYYLVVPDFMDKYTAHVLANCVKDGYSATELAEKTTELRDFKKMYDNPLFVVGMTYAEVLPVGLLVALISAFILKRKRRPEQPVANA